MKILFIANCQGAPLVSILSSNNISAEKTEVPIHQLRLSNLARIEKQLKEADVVCSQLSINKHYKELGVDTESLKSRHRNVVVFPNIHYGGYHPTFCMLNSQHRSDAGFAEVYDSTELGPYFDVLCLAAVDLQLEENEIISRISNSQIPMNVELSNELMNELKEREKHCDVKISDVIQEMKVSHALMYSFNHPTNFLLLKVCERILELLQNKRPLTCRSAPYLSNYRLPVYQAVSAMFSVSSTHNWPVGSGAADHQMLISNSNHYHIQKFLKTYSCSDHGASGEANRLRGTFQYKVSMCLLDGPGRTSVIPKSNCLPNNTQTHNHPELPSA